MILRVGSLSLLISTKHLPPIGLIFSHLLFLSSDTFASNDIFDVIVLFWIIFTFGIGSSSN